MPAVAVGIEQPTIFRERGKQFSANGDDMHLGKRLDQVLKQWRGIGRMANFRRNDKGHPATGR